MSEKEKDDAFAAFGKKLNDIEEKDKQKRKEMLKEGTSQIQQDNKKGFGSELVNRQLSYVQQEAGLSAFTDASGEIKSPKLRRGSFLKILARELLLIGLEELPSKVTTVSSLASYFATNRTNWKLREKDIPEALEILEKDDLIPPVVAEDEDYLVFFAPIELTEDPKRLIIIASGVSDLTFANLESITGWSKSRLMQAVEYLSKQGVISYSDDEMYFMK